MQPPSDVSVNAGHHACSRRTGLSGMEHNAHARSTPNPPPNRRHRSIPNRQPESIVRHCDQAELSSLGLERRDQSELRQVHTFLISWPLGHKASRQNSKQLSTQGITGSSRPAATCPRSRLFISPASTHASVRGLQSQVPMSLVACHRCQHAYSVPSVVSGQAWCAASKVSSPFTAGWLRR